MTNHLGGIELGDLQHTVRERIERFQSAVFFHDFGFILRRLDEEQVDLAMAVRRKDLQVAGVVHGGILTTLADTAAVLSFYPFLPEGHRTTSIEFKLNFLAPALPGKGELLAKARCVKRGRRVALSDLEIYQATRMVAKGLFTYLVWEESSAENS